MNGKKIEDRIYRELDVPAKDQERYRRFRPIDDTFLRIIARDNIPLVQRILRIATEDENLTVAKSETQRDLKRIDGSRSLELDIFAETEDARIYNIEVERKRERAGPDRCRYHTSLLDVENLEEGHEWTELPDVTVIMITEKNPFRKNLPRFHVERIVREEGSEFGDRQHILYLNGAYRDDTEIGRLMHDFLCSDPDEMLIEEMRDAVAFYKKTKEGVKKMCDISREFYDDGFKDGKKLARMDSIKQLMENKDWTPEQSMDALGIEKSEQKLYLAELYASTF